MPPPLGTSELPLGEEGGADTRAGGVCVISQDTMLLEAVPLGSRNVTRSMQSWQPRIPQGVRSYGNSTFPISEEEEEKEEAAAEGDGGRYSIVRGRDEMR